MDKQEKRMKDGIQLTIIEKIEALMDANNVSQAALARGTDIAQARLSKCLSRSGSNCFGIDTLMKISGFFGVPVDSLLGRTTLGAASAPQSNADICRQLINLIETGTVNIAVRKIEQDICHPNREDGTHPYRYEKKSVTYKMFYFSNYNPMPEMEKMNEKEKSAAGSEPGAGGLYHPKGIEINAFIEYYLKLRDLYRSNELPRAFFEQAIEDRLNQMRY